MTDCRTTQTLLEVWTTNETRGILSQTLLEAWINRLPLVLTGEVVSQALAEVWGTNLAQSATQLVVSTALVEVWVPLSYPQPLRVSSQVI